MNGEIINGDNKVEQNLEAFDLGPGNCLIDEWVRKNSNKKFDKDGLIAKSGKINKLISFIHIRSMVEP